jgi:hypothetical protein
VNLAPLLSRGFRDSHTEWGSTCKNWRGAFFRSISAIAGRKKSRMPSIWTGFDRVKWRSFDAKAGNGSAVRVIQSEMGFKILFDVM